LRGCCAYGTSSAVIIPLADALLPVADAHDGMIVAAIPAAMPALPDFIKNSRRLFFFVPGMINKFYLI